MRTRAARFSWVRMHDDPAQAASRYAETRTPCSCWMCGNPRRHFGERSRQERAAEIAEA
jgi:hypothetical protein